MRQLIQAGVLESPHETEILQEMSMRNAKALLASLAVATGGMLAAKSASAQTACPDNAVVIRGSSASEPLINAVAVLAKAQGIDIVYSSSGGSCLGVGSVIPTGTPPVLQTTGGGKTKFDAANQNATCNLATARAADIGASDVYSTSCSNIGAPATPATVLDYLGPVQAFVLAVYDDPSFPVVISDQAAFNIFGITARGGDASFAVSPWIVPADLLTRNETSGTQQTWARAAGLPIAKFSDPKNDQTGAGPLLAKINTSPRSSILGILALNDIVATGTPPVQPKVRPLAFKAKGQDFGYYTSSTSTASDMINVRDGHYSPWANIHFFTNKDATTGKASNANVQKVLDLIETQTAVTALAKARVVPQCAMQVSRTEDQGNFTAYKPAKPCGCFFEKEASGTAPASCTACTDDTACGSSGQCVYGFCEAK